MEEGKHNQLIFNIFQENTYLLFNSIVWMKLEWRICYNDAMKRYLPLEKFKIHQDFQHQFKVDLILLTDTQALTLHSTTQIKPSCASCLGSWSTSLTLGKYSCSNVQLRRCKPTNVLTITSANYLYLHMEQLFRTR